MTVVCNAVESVRFGSWKTCCDTYHLNWDPFALENTYRCKSRLAALRVLSNIVTRKQTNNQVYRLPSLWTLNLNKQDCSNQSQTPNKHCLTPRLTLDSRDAKRDVQILTARRQVKKRSAWGPWEDSLEMIITCWGNAGQVSHQCQEEEYHQARRQPSSRPGKVQLITKEYRGENRHTYCKTVSNKIFVQWGSLLLAKSRLWTS